MSKPESALDGVMQLLGVTYGGVKLGNQSAASGQCCYILAVETAVQILGSLESVYVLFGFDTLQEVERYLLLEHDGDLDYHVISVKDADDLSKLTVLPYYIVDGGKYYVPWVAFFNRCQYFEGDLYDVAPGKDPDKVYGVDFR